MIDALAFLRRNHSLLKEHKVIMVLDQFEQWLFARGRDAGTELIAALRQCDGEHIQALCLVRDDFWMAATRFMKDLEIDLVPHRNVAAVDLFDLRHARRVLAAFGRAYDCLPAEHETWSRDQNAFLNQVTTGLAQEGWIVPVRLALFAEMVKGKPWTHATLREVGGMDGVGLRFLEETFSSARSNPEHRYHQKAAQNVLKSLLPETNSDIKGRMRSSQELRQASGYSDRPGDFDHLIRILDSELRLITPVDLESSLDEEKPVTPPGGRYYQLTHDYLVHSLREWLTRKQKSTLRGRTELLLAERSALWNSKPDSHHLPSLREWATVRLVTKPSAWSDHERRMMSRTDRKAGIRAAFVTVALCGLLASGFLIRRSVNDDYDRNHARQLVLRLQDAEIAKVAESIADMRDYRRWTDPALRTVLEQSEHDPGRKLRASLALLASDPTQAEYLSRRLIDATPAELSVLCQFLAGRETSLAPTLWAILEANGPDDARVLGPAGALAHFDHDSPRWHGVAGKVARAMVSVNPIHVSEWLLIFRPASDQLRAALKEILQDVSRDESDRMHAMSYLVDYASENPRELVDLLENAGAKEFALVLPGVERWHEQSRSLLEREVDADDALPAAKVAENDRRAERQAKAAVALFRLGGAERVWPLLVHKSDPRVRGFLIHWLTRLGGDPGTTRACLQKIETIAQARSSAGKIAEIESEKDPNRSSLFDPATSTERALILIAGSFDVEHLANEECALAIKKLVDIYRDDPDPGVHGAARWALGRWHQSKLLNQIDPALAQRKTNDESRWFVNSVGQTMVRIEGPLNFRIGAPETEPEYHEEIRHDRRIPRRFAIAATEVSIGDFEAFWNEHSKEHSEKDSKEGSKKDSCEFGKPEFRPGSAGQPRGGVSWYMAAAYCNWLSKKERRKPVYSTNEEGKYAKGMRLTADSFDGGGYRLPTEAEWEYACRAGTETSRYFGYSRALIRDYAQISWEQDSDPSLCGSLLPNDFGLFDMLGNLMEWCHDEDYDYEDFKKETKSDHFFKSLIDGPHYVMRGGSIVNKAHDARAPMRTKYEPGQSHFTLGFRIARSLP